MSFPAQTSLPVDLVRLTCLRRALWEPHLGDHCGVPDLGRDDSGLQHIQQSA